MQNSTVIGYSIDSLEKVGSNASISARLGVLGLVLVLAIAWILYHLAIIVYTNRWTEKLKKLQKMNSELRSKLSPSETTANGVPEESADGRWDIDSSSLEDDPDYQIAMSVMREFKKGIY